MLRGRGVEAGEVEDGLVVTVATYRGDIFEEMDLVEEVLRFFGLNNVPAMLPRVTTGDVRREAADVAEDTIRDVLVGCSLSEAINYSFIRPEWNALISDETPVAITNALSEAIEAMRLSLIPGLLETVAFNRSYGTRDGGFFEVGRTYHRLSDNRQPTTDNVHEHHRIAIVLYGSIGTFWGDAKRPVDFFDIKGIIEQIAAKMHVDVTFAASDQRWLRSGKRATAWHGDREIASVGFLSGDVLHHF